MNADNRDEKGLNSSDKDRPVKALSDAPQDENWIIGDRSRQRVSRGPIPSRDATARQRDTPIPEHRAASLDADPATQNENSAQNAPSAAQNAPSGASIPAVGRRIRRDDQPVSNDPSGAPVDKDRNAGTVGASGPDAFLTDDGRFVTEDGRTHYGVKQLHSHYDNAGRPLHYIFSKKGALRIASSATAGASDLAARGGKAAKAAKAAKTVASGANAIGNAHDVVGRYIPKSDRPAQFADDAPGVKPLPAAPANTDDPLYRGPDAGRTRQPASGGPSTPSRTSRKSAGSPTTTSAAQEPDPNSKPVDLNYDQDRAQDFDPIDPRLVSHIDDGAKQLGDDGQNLLTPASQKKVSSAPVIGTIVDRAQDARNAMKKHGEHDYRGLPERIRDGVRDGTGLDPVDAMSHIPVAGAFLGVATDFGMDAQQSHNYKKQNNGGFLAPEPEKSSGSGVTSVEEESSEDSSSNISPEEAEGKSSGGMLAALAFALLMVMFIMPSSLMVSPPPNDGKTGKFTGGLNMEWSGQYGTKCGFQYLEESGSFTSASVPDEWMEAITATAATVGDGFTPDIIAAQLYQESRFNPNEVSNSQALGLGQFKQATWDWLQIPGSPFNPLDAIAGMVYIYQFQKDYAAKANPNVKPGDPDYVPMMLQMYYQGQQVANIYPTGDSFVEAYSQKILGSGPLECGETNQSDGVTIGAANMSKDKKEVLSQINPSEWMNPLPTGVVTSEFGYRDYGDAWTVMNHGGLDIGTYGGTNDPILAPTDMKVTQVKYDEGGGNMLIARQTGSPGLVMAFLHCASRPPVEVGQTVRKGTRICDTGMTGTYASGVHLHWQIMMPFAPDTCTSHGYSALMDPREVLAAAEINLGPRLYRFAPFSEPQESPWGTLC